MAQIKSSIIVLLLLGLVAVGVYAAGDGKLPWPPPPVADVGDEPPPPTQPRSGLPHVVDRPKAPMPSQPPPAPQPNGLPCTVLPNGSPVMQLPPPIRSGPANPYPLMAMPTEVPQAPPVADAPPQALPSLPKVPALTPVEVMVSPMPAASSVNKTPSLPPPPPGSLTPPVPLPPPAFPNSQAAPPAPLPPSIVSNPQPPPLPPAVPSFQPLGGGAPSAQPPQMPLPAQFEPQTAPSALRFAPAIENPAGNEPRNQPKQISSFRVLINIAPQNNDFPASQESYAPLGNVVAASTSATYPSPVPRYQNPQPIMRSVPIYKNEPRPDDPTQDAQTFNTPVTAQMLPPKSMKPGELVTYEIVLRNPANVAARDVVLEVKIEGGRLERASPMMPKANKSGDLTWTFPTFPSGSLMSVKLMIWAGKDCRVSCSPTGPPIAEATSSRAARMSNAPLTQNPRQIPSLAISMTGPANAEVDQPATFYVRVVNTGSQPIVDPMFYLSLPAGLKNLNGSDRGKFSTLLPGAEKTLPIRVTGAAPGRHTLHCWVTMANVRLGTASASIAVGQPGLQIIQHPTTRLLTGQSGEIRFQVLNNSAQELQHVGVTSNLPDGLHLTFASDHGIFHSSRREVTWLIDLKPNESKVLSIQVEADRAGAWTHEVRAVAGSAEVAGTAKLKVDGSTN